jgi:uncharacterized repeat protein (TIGR01451 family)
MSIDGPDFFPSPGPGAGPFGSLLSAFNGVSPNGAWSLYVRDDNNVDSGVILGGWCINFIEGTLVNPGGDLAVTMTDSPDPAFAGQTITYSITVTNAGGNVAENVVLTNTLPAGVTYNGSTNGFGSTFQSGNTVIFQLGNIAVGGAKTVTVVANALSAGSFTNRATVTSTLTDGLAGNNTATAITTVIVASDLSVSIVDSPDAVILSNRLTYVVTVFNPGPSPASSVVLSNFLPAGVTFVAATNLLGSVSHAAGVVTANLGTLGIGASGQVTIVGSPTLVGQVTDTATATSVTSELNPTNNTASAKTVVVVAPTLLQVQSGGSFLFSWPSAANNFVLQCTTNITPPAVWTTVTDVPVDSGGIRTVTVPIDPAASVKVFRLLQVP